MILQLTNKVVHEKALSVTHVDAKVIQDMWDTMYAGNGIGLAAPQVGISKRLVVMHVGNIKLELHNPIITATSAKTTSAMEGCLSFPGKQVKVRRFIWVEITASNLEEPIKLKKLAARCVQHEIDHLNGVTIC